MRWGLFGKLPSKRDFVAIGVPAAFLAAWERWLQAGMAESRAQLGDAWPDMYLVAPLWRFWLSERIAGTAVTGVVMPSVDGVGRHFPLSVFLYSGGVSPPLPRLAEQWLSRVDGVLLAGLERRTDVAQLHAALAAIVPCPDALHALPPPTADEAGSMWWTSGIPDPPSFVLPQHTLPDVAFFVRLLRGPTLLPGTEE